MSTSHTHDASPTLAPRALCSEVEIRSFVHAFYARIRVDAALGPIFNGHIDDWDAHLAKLCDFWSSLLLRTGRFSGAPMPKHAVLPDLSAALFERWLALFRTTLADQPNTAMADAANHFAERVAQSLWQGYQLLRAPGVLPGALTLD